MVPLCENLLSFWDQPVGLWIAERRFLDDLVKRDFASRDDSFVLQAKLLHAHTMLLVGDDHLAWELKL